MPRSQWWWTSISFIFVNCDLHFNIIIIAYRIWSIWSPLFRHSKYDIITWNIIEYWFVICDCRQCVAAIKPVVAPKVTSVTFQIRSASRLPPTTPNPCWRSAWPPSPNRRNKMIEIMTCHAQAVDLAQMGKRVVCWHLASTAAVRTQTWVLDSFRTKIGPTKRTKEKR